MSVRYKYSGLTEELYQRLVSEHAALRKTHKKGSYKQFFQEVKQCSELQARIIIKRLIAQSLSVRGYRPKLSIDYKALSPMNYSTIFKTICLLITQEGKPRAQCWIKPTQDCQNTYLNGSRRKWKDYARNTLTI